MSDYDESEYLAEATEQAKRNYLEDEITDLNYDPNLFSEFFQYTTEGSELSDITFDQLQEIVKDFKTRFRPKQTLEQVKKEKQKQEEKEKRLYEIPTKRKYQLKYNPPVTKQENQPKSSLEAEKAIVNPLSSSKSLLEHQLSEPAKLEKSGVSKASKKTDTAKKPNPPTESELIDISKIPEKPDDDDTFLEDDVSNLPSQRKTSLEVEEKEPETNALEEVVAIEKYTDAPINYEDSPESISIDTADVSHLPRTFSVQCKRAEKTELYRCKNLEITLSEAELVRGGLFSHDYTVYYIKTAPLNWNVRRRYSDFIWLRAALAAEFPTTCLPPLPPKKSIGRLDSHTIFKRQHTLSKFLIDLSCCPIAKTSMNLIMFLRDRDVSSKQPGKKNRRPEELDDLVTLKGKVVCDLNDHSEHYKQLINYLQMSEENTKKLNKEGAVILENLHSLSISLQRYSELLSAQSKIQELLPEAIPTKRLSTHLSDTFLNWADFENQKMSRVYQYCKLQYSYFQRECEGLRNLAKEWENAHKRFLKKQGPNDYYGYLNHHCMEEAKRVLHNSTRQNISNFLEMARVESENSVAFHHIWSGLFGNLTDFQYSFKNK